MTAWPPTWKRSRALEEANVKLSSILKWHQQRDSGNKQDYSQYEESISHLQEQVRSWVTLELRGLPFRRPMREEVIRKDNFLEMTKRA